MRVERESERELSTRRRAEAERPGGKKADEAEES